MLCYQCRIQYFVPGVAKSVIFFRCLVNIAKSFTPPPINSTGFGHECYKPSILKNYYKNP